MKVPWWLPLLAFLSGCGGDETARALYPQGPCIRVQVLPDQSGVLILSASGRVRLSTLPGLIPRFEGSLSSRTEVQVDGEGFRLAEQYYPSPIRISSLDRGPISIRPHGTGAGSPGPPPSYRGSLDLLNISGRIRVINELSMEEYLAGVVPGEMPGSFSQAALEAQAVASRTYALYHLVRRGPMPLDEAFNSTSLFQVYRGYGAETPGVRRAILATSGWVLTYRGKLFPAYYHSTCGGSTTNGSWVFGLPEIPPLRGVPCNDCVRSLSHRWKFSVPLLQVEGLLKGWARENRISMGDLLSLKGVDPLPGGYLRYVEVVHSGGSFEMRADLFRRTLNEGGLPKLKSTSFEVEPGEEAGILEFRGSGWGHGVGMCQYGADWKGRNSSYGEILAHYYPESELKKVY